KVTFSLTKGSCSMKAPVLVPYIYTHHNMGFLPLLWSWTEGLKEQYTKPSVAFLWQFVRAAGG
ncbi:MAG TPA: hypothetical protein PKC93_18845, partial [Candidatus Obscuribacter sp.]|nr:hypothetical protein [Candidatus Obscuribacter sp.]